MLEELATLLLGKVLLLESLYPPGSLYALRYVRVELLTLRPLVELPQGGKVRGHAQGGEPPGKEFVLIFQDVRPRELVKLLSLLPYPLEEEPEGTAVEVTAAFLHVLGGNEVGDTVLPLAPVGNNRQGGGLCPRFWHSVFYCVGHFVFCLPIFFGANIILYFDITKNNCKKLRKNPLFS